MFQRLFRRDRGVSRDTADALYDAIVAAARQPVFYADWEVPDTPIGRFEMISLHMFLVHHRLRNEQGPLREVAQLLIDGFFTDIDHSLRELGISDMGVPKRIKKLARMFYGRTASYADALMRDDREALAAALARNVRPDAAEWSGAPSLARYMEAADRSLAAQPSEAIAAGQLSFPEGRSA